MTDSLRERRASATAHEIRRAFVRLATDRATEGFSLAEVADAAGISERTLYRYYANRQAIVEAVALEDDRALDAELARRRGDTSGADALDDPDFFATTFECFEEHIELVDFIRRTRGTAPESVSRTGSVRSTVAAIGLDDADTEALTGVLRVLLGSDAWLRMREHDLDLTPTQAGHAVQWAARTLVDAARAGRGPLRPPGGSPR